MKHYDMGFKRAWWSKRWRLAIRDFLADVSQNLRIRYINKEKKKRVQGQQIAQGE